MYNNNLFGKWSVERLYFYNFIIIIININTIIIYYLYY